MLARRPGAGSRVNPRLNPVVVEVDGSADGLRVVDFATQEALRDDVELVLARAYRGYGTTPQDATWSRNQAGRELRAACAHVRRQVGWRVRVRTIAREGPRPVVLAQLSRNARLLVVARRNARGPQRLVAAHEDLLLAGASRCPVVVVQRAWKPDSTRSDVAVGVDGTELSWEAVGHAFAAADRRGGRLFVVHAEPGPNRRVSEAAELTWANAAGLTLAETVAGWQELYPDVRITPVVTSEPVTLALTRWSDRAGLLVLGIHSGRNRLIADPVAREALAAATSPVVLVSHTASSRGLDGRARAASRR